MVDAQLIEKFREGDIDAFNLLVRRWEKNVFNFVLRYMGDREESKDVCQQTFVRTYRKLNRLKEPEKFSTWLYQIAINICRDELKKRHRRKTYSLQQLEDKSNGFENHLSKLGPGDRTHPENEVYQNDLAQLLNRALQTIPEEQRLVIIMKEYQGLKFTEIADVLKTPVNTVKSRMYYGLRALRKIFKKWNIQEEMLKNEV